MNGHRRWFRGATVLAILLLSALAAVIAYNLGVSHGLAQQIAAQGGQLPPYGPYGWYRPWGFGFGFPILFFVLIWFVVMRGVFWGGRWRRGYYDGGWRGVPPVFDEWHRQAHEHLKEDRPADDPGRRG